MCLPWPLICSSRSLLVPLFAIAAKTLARLPRICSSHVGAFAPSNMRNVPKSPTGRVAQSVTCLATDACLIADPGVASSIPARYDTFVEIDHEIISTVILLPSADLFKKGWCQLQAKVCAQITG